MSYTENVCARGYAPQSFSNDTQWINGSHVFIDPTDGPVEITLDLGIVVFGSGTDGSTVEFEVFIRNADTNETLAYNIFTSPALSGGYSSAKPPAMTARIPKGAAAGHYVGVVSGANTNNTNPVTVTLNPTWAPDGTSFVTMKAVNL
ncbi:hypothetical protein [Gordonia sp. N1V]|uniref:hypothetical protein n=1 Tax=Gordonia sp. N1V TaxID=3034163 RepID=UPI0023E0B9FC|nr:hypothetical protein [Gordonia sp. N1V]MDF3280933.1 hypothetical protein [Gordonia sp. N1V]